jgi:3-hydroxyacyl-[acyl-carrier-protein] dehydratase
LVAERLFRPEEWYFRVHFPGRPVVPGVILIEAMAHALGVLAGLAGHARDGGWRHFALVMVEQAKFYRPVPPTSLVSFQARLQTDDDGVVVGRVAARSDGDLVARADIRLGTSVFADGGEALQDDPFGLRAYLTRVLDPQLHAQFALAS